jgi:mRNA interferase RelE/StbE
VEVKFKKSFSKTLKLTPKHIQESVQTIIIHALLKAESLESAGLDYAKMAGTKKDEKYYRIRVGDWRIGIEYVNPNVVLIKILSRGSIYKQFP